MKQAKLIDRKTPLINQRKMSRKYLAYEPEKSEKIDVVEYLVCLIERKTTKKSDELNTTHQKLKLKLKTVF